MNELRAFEMSSSDAIAANVSATDKQPQFGGPNPGQAAARFIAGRCAVTIITLPRLL